MAHQYDACHGLPGLRMSRNVLIVEDEQELAKVLKRHLEDASCAVELAFRGDDGLRGRIGGRNRHGDGDRCDRRWEAVSHERFLRGAGECAVPATGR